MVRVIRGAPKIDVYPEKFIVKSSPIHALRVRRFCILVSQLRGKSFKPRLVLQPPLLPLLHYIGLTDC